MDRVTGNESLDPARRDGIGRTRAPGPDTATTSWQPPGSDLYGQLIVAIIQKADADPAVRIGGNNARGGRPGQLVPARQHYYVALDAERAIEYECSVLVVIG